MRKSTPALTGGAVAALLSRARKGGGLRTIIADSIAALGSMDFVLGDTDR